MGLRIASLFMLWLALSNTNEIRKGRTRNHGHYVCSTWGNNHFKTFDGDVYQFPGICEYNFVSDCQETYKEFSVHIQRGLNSNNHPEIQYILLTIKDFTVYLQPKLTVVDGRIVKTPYYSSGLLIESSDIYTKVYAKLGLILIWNQEDALMVELDSKFSNQTCGLCGDYNGIPIYNEFISGVASYNAITYGNLQKISKPNDKCEDPDETLALPSCNEHRDECERLLTSSAFDDCQSRLNLEMYIQACMQDKCACNGNEDSFCLCSTISEYSRQCSHAGGRPGEWRTQSFCPKTCPGNMIYRESGSPCMDTCSHLEISSLCEEHYMDGCFCPEGTVYDDITEKGCIPVSQCHCRLHGKGYSPGESITNECEECTCDSGRWTCKDLPCPGTCSVEGGSHITTFDGKKYTFHGDCYYVLAKGTVNDTHALLAELAPCGSTDGQTCLKTVVLLVDAKKNVVVFKSDGSVLLNEMTVNVPHVSASFSVFKPSSYYLIVQTSFGLQLQIQLFPIMQLFVTVDQSVQGNLQGLCGNFNGMEGDDFKTTSGLVEATGSAFANTWKAQSICADQAERLEDPCSLSIESANYAEHWCSLLKNSEGPFARCHSIIDPSEYYKRCKYDTCLCKDNEECLCAALSSYSRACAFKGIILGGWRQSICTGELSACPGNQIFLYNLTMCQQTCRSIADGEKHCLQDFAPVDGCGCPDNTYLDNQDTCVPVSKCPCYYKGSYLEPGEYVIKDGERCVCRNAKVQCTSVYMRMKSITECPSNKTYFDCNTSPNWSSQTPIQLRCGTPQTDHYQAECVSGCVCPEGLFDDGRGGCVKEEDCPCFHNNEWYNHGRSIAVDCNTCTCQKGVWSCTETACYGTCMIYGSGHYITFDGKFYDFDGSCEYVATQDYCGDKNSVSSFSIITENVPCGTTGVTCSKAIKMFLGKTELKLENKDYKEIQRDVGDDVYYWNKTVGLYLVIEASNGVMLIWDKKTTVFIKLTPDYKGKVCGLCGNFDDKSNNDFTTRSGLQETNALTFGNSWKQSSMCPDVTEEVKPCDLKPHRKSWAEKECSLILGEVFKICHSKVNPTPFYDACVHDACSCDSGGDCDCFCSAVAAYAQECTKAQACVFWRTPDICPIFCDYYNPRDVCEWHYEPCGSDVMTCRMINNVSTNFSVPYLEGCYPRCPEKTPIYNEETKECVTSDKCWCYVNGSPVRPGEEIPTEENCTKCVCGPSGSIDCAPIPACPCVINGTRYEVGEAVAVIQDGVMCTVYICAANGTVVLGKHFLCPSTTSPLISTTPSTPSSTSTIITSTGTATITTIGKSSTEIYISPCLGLICDWSQWFDVSKPEEGGGDYETYYEINKHGHEICNLPENIECRAKNKPDLSLEQLGQKVECNVTYGLICKNEEQDTSIWHLCYNYEIRVNCCEWQEIPCGTPTTSPVTIRTTVPTSTATPPTKSTTSPPITTPATISQTTPPVTSPVTSASTVPTTTPTPTPSESPTSATTSMPPLRTTSTLGTTTTVPGTSVPTPTITSMVPPTIRTQTQPPPTTLPLENCDCIWTDWFDVSKPNISDVNSGDYETFENIKKYNTSWKCLKAENISCRATDKRETSLEDLGQKVECNVNTGLICNNKDQVNSDTKYCHNYEISICCIEKQECIPSTEYRTSTPTTVSTTRSTATTTTLWTPTRPPVSTTGPSSTTSGTTPSSSPSSTTSGTTPSSSSTPGTTPVTPPTTTSPTTLTTTSASTPTPTHTTSLSPPSSTSEGPTPPGTTTVPVSTTTLPPVSTTGPSSTTSGTTPSSSSTPGTTPVTPPTTMSPTTLTTTSASTPTPTHTTSLSPPSSTSEEPCTVPPEGCTWTDWIDKSYPQYGPNGGDDETFETIQINRPPWNCAKVENISCRAEKWPDIPISDLGQKVECNVNTGLLCKNEDQKPGGIIQMPVCINYQIKVCCATELPPWCTTTPTSTTTTTIHSTTTELPHSTTTSTPLTTTTTKTTLPLVSTTGPSSTTSGTTPSSSSTPGTTPVTPPTTTSPTTLTTTSASTPTPTHTTSLSPPSSTSEGPTPPGTTTVPVSTTTLPPVSTTGPSSTTSGTTPSSSSTPGTTPVTPPTTTSPTTLTTTSASTPTPTHTTSLSPPSSTSEGPTPPGTTTVPVSTTTLPPVSTTGPSSTTSGTTPSSSSTPGTTPVTPPTTTSPTTLTTTSASTPTPTHTTSLSPPSSTSEGPTPPGTTTVPVSTTTLPPVSTTGPSSTTSGTTPSSSSTPGTTPVTPPTTTSPTTLTTTSASTPTPTHTTSLSPPSSTSEGTSPPGTPPVETVSTTTRPPISTTGPTPPGTTTVPVSTTTLPPVSTTGPSSTTSGTTPSSSSTPGTTPVTPPTTTSPTTLTTTSASTPTPTHTTSLSPPSSTSEGTSPPGTPPVETVSTTTRPPISTTGPTPPGTTTVPVSTTTLPPVSTTGPSSTTSGTTPSSSSTPGTTPVTPPTTTSPTTLTTTSASTPTPTHTTSLSPPSSTSEGTSPPGTPPVETVSTTTRPPISTTGPTPPGTTTVPVSTTTLPPVSTTGPSSTTSGTTPSSSSTPGTTPVTPPTTTSPTTLTTTSASTPTPTHTTSLSPPSSTSEGNCLSMGTRTTSHVITTVTASSSTEETSTGTGFPSTSSPTIPFSTATLGSSSPLSTPSISTSPSSVSTTPSEVTTSGTTPTKSFTTTSGTTSIPFTNVTSTTITTSAIVPPGSTSTSGTTPTSSAVTVPGSSTYSTVTTLSTSSATPSPGANCTISPNETYAPGESWWPCNCTKAVCVENNTVQLFPVICEPPPKPTCANGLAPVQVLDDDQCCWHWECDCYCTGWGDPHYMTFDGLYYSYQGNCTYVLVEEINKTVDNFGVYIDNYHCDARDVVSCPRTLIVRHETQEVRIATVELNTLQVEVTVNKQPVALPYKKFGVSIYESGINRVVEIPELKMNVSYNGLSFSIRMPYSLFGNNTQGQCGTCNNNTADDCRLPNGNIAENCETMADHWQVVDPSKPQCSPGLIPTKSPGTTTGQPCKESSICKLILGRVFEKCHAVVNPDRFYAACVFDSCALPSLDLECSSLQIYAAICADQNVCIDWRSHTNGVCCTYECPKHKEYRACGPSKEITCKSSQQNETAVKQVEGCFCPNGTMLYDSGVDVCVNTCGCVGLDMIPREFGERFTADCQDCICLEGGSGIVCEPHKCPSQNKRSCNGNGFYEVSEVNPEDSCCPIVTCKCNTSLCTTEHPKCTLGFEVYSHIPSDQCCPVYECVPKRVCVHQNAEFLPNSSVFVDKCQNCFCTNEVNVSTQLNVISCEHVPCDTYCEPGYERQSVKGECCGKCVQTKCIIHASHSSNLILSPGEFVKDPYDNCTIYSCTSLHNQLISSTSEITCPAFSAESCKPGTITFLPNGCCKTCIPLDSPTPCSVREREDFIVYKNCRSVERVVMTECEGTCGTFSLYSVEANSLEHSCSCCREAKTSTREVELKCPSGHSIQHKYVYVESCSCQDTHCNIPQSSEPLSIEENHESTPTASEGPSV
ncbi:mucin-2 [Cygnus atratus]|uniref:mucin-2 n=1 Tax=Cygnus atratus TaxID=8868 RepID=UPI0015D59401|nr:mucin-2 [Cygnus atratus]